MSQEIKNPLLKKFLSVFEEAQKIEAGLAKKTPPPAPKNTEGEEEKTDQTEDATEQLQEKADNNNQTSPEKPEPEPNTTETTFESKIAGQTTQPQQLKEEANGTGQDSTDKNETEIREKDDSNANPDEPDKTTG